MFRESTNILAETGLMFMNVGNKIKAFEYLGNALTYNPRNAKAILGAGAIIQSNGDFDVALTKYRVGVTRTPNSAYLWNNIGMAFFWERQDSRSYQLPETGHLLVTLHCCNQLQFGHSALTQQPARPRLSIFLVLPLIFKVFPICILRRRKPEHTHI